MLGAVALTSCISLLKQCVQPKVSEGLPRGQLLDAQYGLLIAKDMSTSSITASSALTEGTQRVKLLNKDQASSGDSGLRVLKKHQVSGPTHSGEGQCNVTIRAVTQP
ncbi:hypothetical protein LIA77_09873 [Sarocladium implicatum]|nr:hypothetical protein LIA77_09873 [Sarocladium implicatum]